MSLLQFISFMSNVALEKKIDCRASMIFDGSLAVDAVLQPENRAEMTLEDQLHQLLEKLDATECIKHSAARSKRSKQLRKEINNIRRRLAIQRGKEKLRSDGDASRNMELTTEDSSSKD